jgi:hypothetical protein
MKKITLAIVLIASLSIIAISCDWFKSDSKPVTSSNPLIGNWKLDSVQVGKDTTLGHALLLMAMHEDTSGIQIQFKPDTIFTHSKNDVDTTFYQFDDKNNLLSFKDSTEKPYHFIKLNDSLISLQRDDSSALFLKKQ